MSGTPDALQYNDKVRPSWMLAVLVATGCARGVAVVEVSWQVCAVVRTPEGNELDDAGVDVVATLRRVHVERVDAGHYPGACWREPGELSRLVCGDPHIDVRYVLQWTRPAPASLVVERLEYAVSSDDDVPDPTTPQSRRVLRKFAVSPTARVVAAAIPRCRH